LIVNKINAYQFERGQRGGNLNNNQDIMQWVCTNSECRKVNLMDVSVVEMARKKKKKLILVCGNCGYVSTSEDSVEKEKNWLDCIPFTGLQKRLPSHKLGNNKYLDNEGRSYDRNEYIYKHGVDPEIYLNWRNRGSPMSSEG
jgi:hypothetical protein